MCCNKNKSIDSIYIIKILNDKLPKYKIPRMINFVDNISTTKTGKVKR